MFFIIFDHFLIFLITAYKLVFVGQGLSGQSSVAFCNEEIFVSFLVSFLSDLFADLLDLKANLIDFFLLLLFREDSTLFLVVYVIFGFLSKLMTFYSPFHLVLEF